MDCRQRLDRRSIVDYGFHLSGAWWLDLGFGLVLGVFLMAGVYALALAIGWVKVTGTLLSPPGQPFIAAILADVVLVVGIACWEEIVFRGYVIKNLAEGLYSKTIGARWATVIAILIPSVLFGLAHVTNANATMLSTVNTVIFGVVFGAAYALTGELALPIGLHIAWDFVQGFGLGRSGDVPGLGAFPRRRGTRLRSEAVDGMAFHRRGRAAGNGSVGRGLIAGSRVGTVASRQRPSRSVAGTAADSDTGDPSLYRLLRSFGDRMTTPARSR